MIDYVYGYEKSEFAHCQVVGMKLDFKLAWNWVSFWFIFIDKHIHRF